MNEFSGQYQNRTFGNYRLLKLIGEGGFSEVYLGEHRYLGNEAAIKVLRTRLTEEEFERFRQEAQTIIGLGHPNMVRVLEFGVEDHIPFIVMSYAPHGSLRDLFPDGTRVPLERIVQLVKQVAAALQYAHDHQVIHRDIKPDNLLIGPDGEVLLSDFGIAVAAHNTYSQKTQEAIGTVAYMAPEQLRRKARTASDQYALAVMVYEWLSGEVPFSGAPIEVALQHLNDSPPALSAVDIPPAVEEVVLKALAKDPPARFASVQAFADALEAAAQGDAIHPGVLDAHITVSSPQGTDKQAKEGQEEREPVAAARRPALLLAEREGRPRGPVGEFFWPRGGSSHGRGLFLASLALIVVIASFGVVLLVQPNPFSLTHSSPTTVSNVSTTIPQSFPTPTSIPTKVPPTSVPTLAPTSKPLAPPAPPTLLLTLPSAVVGVVWSPGGRFYAAADVSGDVGVWQTPNKQQWEVNLGTKIWSLAWSPDSPQAQRIAVAGDDGKVRIFDALSGKQLMLYGGHGAVSVLSVAWSKPYNATAISVVSGDANGVIHVWDPATDNTLVTMNQTAPVDGLASVYSSLISAGAPPGGNIYMWDTSSGQGSEQFNNSNSNIPYGADNPNLVEGTIVSAAWSADATYIALGDTNGNIQLISDTNCSCWMFQTGFLAHKGRVNAISWSSDNATFATASDDGAIKTWRGADGSLVQTYRNPYKAKDSAVAWSPDGQTLLAGDSMGRIMLWQVA